MKLETFFEKFDQFAETPNAVTKMRELILRLAVHGKLVEQNPNEESADDHLPRIKRAKEQLIDERRIRQSDGVEYSEPKHIFTTPKGWTWVYVSDVAVVQGGKRLPKGSTFSDDTTPHYYIRVTDMKNGSISETGLQFISPSVQREIARYTINKEDLYITIAGTIGAVGTVPDTLDGHNLTENAAKIVFRGIDLRFFQIVLSSKFVQAQFLEKTNQMAQPKLALKRIAGAKFCLPPPSEQIRIVVKANHLMALCDQLEAQLQERDTRHAALARTSLARFADAPTPANLNFLFHPSYAVAPADLRKTILTLAVQGKLVPQDPNDEPAIELIERISRGIPAEVRRHQGPPLPTMQTDSLQYEVPDSWSWARFRDVAVIASKLVNPNDYPDFNHLAPDNIEKGNGVLLPCATVREDKVTSSNHRFYPGQIVYSKIRPNLAKVVIVHFEGLCSADMYPINALIDANYLQRYMLSESFLIQAVKTDTRVAMPKINQNELNTIAVPVPPLTEQRRIVAKVDQLMTLVDQLETQIADSSTAAINLMEAVVAELTLQV